jgi:REP-associated tyrosine transposase
MNPVVAGICDDPADYPWSSCRSKIFGKQFEWLDLDPLYESLASSGDERCKRYHEFLSETVSDQERETIIGLRN